METETMILSFGNPVFLAYVLAATVMLLKLPRGNPLRVMWSDLLLTTSQLAIALAGFSAIIVSLNSRSVREWDDTERKRRLRPT